MRLRQLSAALALGISALALSACAESINTTVSRYQAMPAPQGQTFYVVPEGGMANNGGLEFQRYAGLVAQQLAARGYQPAANAGDIFMLAFTTNEDPPGPRLRVALGGGFYDAKIVPLRDVL